MASILDKLTENNEFPVVFIGAGISKRFLKDFPDWTGLLEEFWGLIGESNFYGEFNNLRDSTKKNNPDFNEREVDHFSNIQMGSIIEEKFNYAFNNGKIQIPAFSPKDAYRTKISPFKKSIANRFKQYTLREGIETEFSSFKKMLLKTQIILSTNYDLFIEESYNIDSKYSITKFVGQKGFFKNTYDYAELYKLHGCVDSPNDIIITASDYDNFDKNSVLISAKIISMMMNSPIIFIGYSLTDVNVRKIIREFTRSLTDEEIEILEERLVLVEWLENEENFVEEVISDKDLGCKLKVIKTDNYEKLFMTISSINQGIAPTAVRKYQHVIKELIIDRGKKGALRSVLLSPDEIDKLEENLQNQNITVAIGDAKYIFQIPDIIEYCLDYISDADEISTEIRMRLAVGQNGKARFPVHKILDRELIETSSLHHTEKEKLLGKISGFSNFQKHYETIVLSSVIRIKTPTVRDIILLKTKKEKIYETLSFYIKNLDFDELRSYLLKELSTLKENGEIKLGSELRRLLLLYDIIKYKTKEATPNHQG